MPTTILVPDTNAVGLVGNEIENGNVIAVTLSSPGVPDNVLGLSVSKVNPVLPFIVAAPVLKIL